MNRQLATRRHDRASVQLGRRRSGREHVGGRHEQRFRVRPAARRSSRRSQLAVLQSVTLRAGGQLIRSMTFNRRSETRP